jgi:hypothetical protein
MILKDYCNNQAIDRATFLDLNHIDNAPEIADASPFGVAYAALDQTECWSFTGSTKIVVTLLILVTAFLFWGAFAHRSPCPPNAFARIAYAAELSGGSILLSASAAINGCRWLSYRRQRPSPWALTGWRTCARLTVRTWRSCSKKRSQAAS